MVRAVQGRGFKNTDAWKLGGVFAEEMTEGISNEKRKLLGIGIGRQPQAELLEVFIRKRNPRLPRRLPSSGLIHVSAETVQMQR